VGAKDTSKEDEKSAKEAEKKAVKVRNLRVCCDGVNAGLNIGCNDVARGVVSDCDSGCRRGSVDTEGINDDDNDDDDEPNLNHYSQTNTHDEQHHSHIQADCDKYSLLPRLLLFDTISFTL
jgi:hypothetical protein